MGRRIRLERRKTFSVPTGAELQELIDHRELIFVLASRDVRSRYRHAALGGLWAVMQPLLHVSLLSVFLGRLARVPSQGVPYFIFCITGMLAWQYFSSVVSNSLLNLGGISALMKKVYFPRLVLPAAATLPPLLDLSVNVVITSLIVFLGYQFVPQPQVLLLPVFLALTIVTAFGTVCWFQSLSLLFPDMRHVTPLLMQLLLITSPVMYPVDLVPESYRMYYWINPLATAIEGTRWCLLGIGSPPSTVQLISLVSAALISVSGAVFYLRVSKWFGDLG